MLKKSVIGLVTLGLMLGIAAGPAQAKGPMTGVAVIQCKAFLPSWPAIVTTQGGTCIGTASGAIFGLSTKADGSTNPYVNFCTAVLCPFAANFNYDEICAANGTPPPAGFADGQATVNDNAVIVKNGVPVITTSTLKVPFTWVRVGAFAILEDGKLDPNPNKYQSDPNKHKTFAGQPDNAQDMVGSVAVAAFAPQGIPNNCPAPGPAQLANVVGIDVEIA